MTNRRFLLGLLVIALAFGITVVGCENDLIPDPKLNGTWVYEQTYTGGRIHIQIKFNNGSYEFSTTSPFFSGPIEKGTYTTGSGIINFTSWQINGAYLASTGGASSVFKDRWYSSKEYKDVMKSAGQETYTSVATYEVYDNTLTLTSTSTRDSDGNVTTSSTTYTRK